MSKSFSDNVKRFQTQFVDKYVIPKKSRYVESEVTVHVNPSKRREVFSMAGDPTRPSGANGGVPETRAESKKDAKKSSNKSTSKKK